MIMTRVTPEKGLAQITTQHSIMDSEDEVEIYNDPKWWAKAVTDGNVEELRRGVSAKPSGLCWLDKVGRTLLHVAASCNNVEVIRLLASLKFDLDAQDEQGKTALHEAVQFNSIDAIHALIETGAKCNIPHNGGQFVLLYAVEVNRPACLEALLSHSNIVNIAEADASGSTALHYAAGKNLVDCVKVLLRYDAPICACNNAGMCASNVAAYAGSADALRTITAFAKVNQIEVTRFMNMSDAEGNLPLHAAVDSGSLDTVRVCLEYSAFIDSQQEDQSTPVHFAAMRGELDIIRVMFAAQPARRKSALFSSDKSGMTVLHKAVLFDNVAVAQFFLDEGAEVDAVDANEQTSLLLAASKQSRKCVMLLLERGANSAHKDKDGRNFVHLVVLSGANLESVLSSEVLFKIKHLQELLNQKDYFGCTPLHYASIEGQLSATEHLLNYGAGLDVHTHSKTTALHFAAQYGRYNTCKKLLDSPFGTHIINATDTRGSTALHCAAEFGNTKVVQLLLERGALFHRTYCGSTPFSLAAMGGHIKTMKLMLTFNPNLLNLACKLGFTALHHAGARGHSHAVDFLLSEGAAITLNVEGCTFFDLALKKQNKDVCCAATKHERWREVLSALSPIYPSPIFGLIEELPEVCLQVLNRCVTNNGKPSRSEEFSMTFDFTFLELDRPKARSDAYKSVSLDWTSLDRPSTSSSRLSKPDADMDMDMGSTASLVKPIKKSDLISNKERFADTIHSPLPVINHMLKFGRVELLVSQLCFEYMNTKWKRYAHSHATMDLVSHLVIVIVLALIVWFSPPTIQCYLLIDNYCDESNSTCVDAYMQTPACKMPMTLRICNIILLVFAVSRIPSLIAYALSMKRKFFKSLENVLLVPAVIFFMAYSIPTFTATMMVTYSFQWNLLAIAAALEYFVFILQLRILSSLGLYVVMFVEILKTLLKSGLTFLFLIIGFALAFTILFQVPIENQSDYVTYLGALSFSTPVISLMRTLIMSTGELEFYETIGRAWTDPKMAKGLPFPITTAILFTIFVVLITIAMFNLIVGLAIGDIKVVRSSATLKRIEIQGEFYSLMERFIYDSGFPNCIHEDPRPESVTIYPNECSSRISRLFHDIFTPSDASSSKTIDNAVEAANRLHFQRSVTKKLEKEKQRIKKMYNVMEKHVELTKLMLDKMEVKWDSVQSHDEGLRSMKLEKDIKSLKSNSNANWQELFMTLSSRNSETRATETDNSDEEGSSSPKASRSTSKVGHRWSIWSIPRKKAIIGVDGNLKI